MLATAGKGLAQMGVMRGGYGATAGTSLGGMMVGSLSGMMGGGTGLTIGADGTLYITRSGQVQGQTAQAAATTQLAAIDVNGHAKWTLAIPSSSASQPVLGTDGTLFVTTSDWTNWMYDWMYSRNTPASGTTANLLVIKTAAGSASVVATVPLSGQLASTPQVAADGAGNYVVYVVSVDGFSGNAVNMTTTSGTYLSAFSPAGTLKYKLQLSQGGSGIMGSGMMGGF